MSKASASSPARRGPELRSCTTPRRVGSASACSTGVRSPVSVAMTVIVLQIGNHVKPRRPLCLRRADPGTMRGVLDDDMKRVVREQRLGYVASVCPDGTPNLSPKGTTAVWDDDHLVFANLRSPGTIANLRQNASVEVNVVDPFLRKGYRFKGVASVLESGALYEKAIAFYKDRGSRVSAIREVVLVRVRSAQPIDSP